MDTKDATPEGVASSEGLGRTAAHTPGPWRVEFGQMGGEVFGFSVWAEHGTRWHPVTYQGTYQHTNSECFEPAEKEANGRLIGAAPDLLAALKRMVESVTGVDQVSAVNEARAAIAKATGFVSP